MSKWSAYASATCWIVGNVAVLLFYALEAPALLAGGTKPHIFGPLSDYAGLLQFVCLLPLPLALRQASLSVQRGSATLAALGVSGALLGAIAQALLLTGVIGIEVNIPLIICALALIGGWMLLVSRRARSEGVLSAWLARVGAFTGVSFALVVSLTLVLLLAAALTPGALTNLSAFFQGAPALIGVAIVAIIPAALAYFAGVPIWLIGLGRSLRSSSAVQPETNTA
jgi:hypothetical protein